MAGVQFEQVIPVLGVRNVSNAIAYYTAKLGFELKYADAPHDPRYAVVGRGGVRLHMQYHDEADFAGEGGEYRFAVDDPDRLFEEYRARGAVPEGKTVQDTPWGTREFAFFDPDGNGLFFFRNR